MTATQPMLSLIFLRREDDTEIYLNKSIVTMEIQISAEAERSSRCSIRPASFKAAAEVLCEVGRGLQVGVVRSEVVLDVLQVVVVLQLRHSSVQHLKKTKQTRVTRQLISVQVVRVAMPPHQFQHAEYERRALPDDVVGLTAELHEAVQPLRLLAATRDEVLHLGREDERRAIPAWRHRGFRSLGLCFAGATVSLGEGRLAS